VTSLVKRKKERVCLDASIVISNPGVSERQERHLQREGDAGFKGIVKGAGENLRGGERRWRREVYHVRRDK